MLFPYVRACIAVLLACCGIAHAADEAAAPATAASAPVSAAASASAPDAAASAAPAAIDARMQELKAEALRLNRELRVLEEELMFPPETQVAVFVSLDAAPAFELESVRLELDDKVVATHLYTAPEVQALRRGGVQRVYVGNVRGGKHEMAAVLTGRGPGEGGRAREVKRNTTLAFDKGSEARVIELRIRDQEARLQPVFEVKARQ